MYRELLCELFSVQKVSVTACLKLWALVTTLLCYSMYAVVYRSPGIIFITAVKINFWSLVVDCGSREVRRRSDRGVQRAVGDAVRGDFPPCGPALSCGTFRRGAGGAVAAEPPARPGSALMTVTALTDDVSPVRRKQRNVLQAALRSGSATLYGHRSSKRHCARVLRSPSSVPTPKGGAPPLRAWFWRGLRRRHHARPRFVLLCSVPARRGRRRSGVLSPALWHGVRFPDRFVYPLRDSCRLREAPQSPSRHFCPAETRWQRVCRSTAYQPAGGSSARRCACEGSSRSAWGGGGRQNAPMWERSERETCTNLMKNPPLRVCLSEVFLALPVPLHEVKATFTPTAVQLFPVRASGTFTFKK